MSAAIEKEFNQFQGILREHPEITVENMFDKMSAGLNDWKEKKVNMAFFGAKKQGKASLIDSFFGSTDGGTKTTEKKEGFSSAERPETPTPFGHPENPNITLWYFPNPNMDNAKETERYVKMIAKSQIKPDAFFCLIASTLTPETKLIIKIIQKLNSGNKPVYFVKTKIDSTIDKKVKSTRPEDEVKRRVRENLLVEFESVGIKKKSLNLFLIDSRDPTSHEFSALQEKIITDIKGLFSNTT